MIKKDIVKNNNKSNKTILLEIIKNSYTILIFLSIIANFGIYIIELIHPVFIIINCAFLITKLICIYKVSKSNSIKKATIFFIIVAAIYIFEIVFYKTIFSSSGFY